MGWHLASTICHNVLERRFIKTSPCSNQIRCSVALERMAFRAIRRKDLLAHDGQLSFHHLLDRSHINRLRRHRIRDLGRIGVSAVFHSRRGFGAWLHLGRITTQRARERAQSQKYQNSFHRQCSSRVALCKQSANRFFQMLEIQLNVVLAVRCFRLKPRIHQRVS